MPDNSEIANELERVAELLRARDANPFRIRSYERAAASVRSLERPVEEILDEDGEAGLRRLEHIGEGIARSIRELVETGRLSQRERLESELDPIALLARVPGIGTGLARRIHDELGVHTLEELELAAHDGRLARVEGVGHKRLQGVRDALAGMLSRSAHRRRAGGTRRGSGSAEPPVGLLLDIDASYRRQARAGRLRRIAPRRFNPDQERWLPVMHTERDGWSFQVMYSNTARAHELGRTGDWVVIYFARGDSEDQCTVITAQRGPLAGHRIVRGRERECRAHYAGEG